MKLAGFYQPNIKITLEENVAEISVEDEDTNIKGRMDILAVNKLQEKTINTPFWILVIESKNSSINALVRITKITYLCLYKPRTSNIRLGFDYQWYGLPIRLYAAR